MAEARDFIVRNASNKLGQTHVNTSLCSSNNVVFKEMSKICNEAKKMELSNVYLS